MKNINVDIKSLIIGFLMATCMMMALGANSKPVTVSFPDSLNLSGAFSITHKGGHRLAPIHISD